MRRGRRSRKSPGYRSRRPRDGTRGRHRFRESPFSAGKPAAGWRLPARLPEGVGRLMGDPGWIPLSGSARLRLPSWTPPVREVEELAALPLRAARHQALGATGNENARHGDGPLLCRRRRVRLGKTPMHRSRRSRSCTRSCVCMGTEREQDLPAANLKLCVSFRRSYQVAPMTVLAGLPTTRGHHPRQDLRAGEHVIDVLWRAPSAAVVRRPLVGVIFTQ